MIENNRGSITITEIQKLLFQLGCTLHQRASRTNKQIPASEKGLNQIKIKIYRDFGIVIFISICINIYTRYIYIYVRVK